MFGSSSFASRSTSSFSSTTSSSPSFSASTTSASPSFSASPFGFFSSSSSSSSSSLFASHSNPTNPFPYTTSSLPSSSSYPFAPRTSSPSSSSSSCGFSFPLSAASVTNDVFGNKIVSEPDTWVAKPPPSSPPPPSAEANHNECEAVEEVLSLKVLVEKKHNRVVFVESNSDFVDVVFSFLTLPIGRILSLLRGKYPSVYIGCMENVYASVTKLNERDFVTEACKDMLLHPRTSSEAQFRKLKLKYDDSLETPKCFYFCQNLECRRQGRGKLSEVPDARCQCCGQLVDQLATLSEQDGNVTCGEEGGVFAKGGSFVFLVTDGMEVMPGLGLLSIELLKKLGVNDANELEIQSFEVTPEKVLQLLGLSIISRTPITNWISSEQDSSGFTGQERSTETPDEHYKANGSPVLTKVEQESSSGSLDECSETTGCNVLNNDEQRGTADMKLVLFFSKSRNVVLYAECDEDFVNFLFGLLTLPLGSSLKILDGDSQLGSFDNLYRSVTDLNRNGHLKSEELKDMLLCPKLAPFSACENQLLQIEESCHPEYKLLATRNDPNVEWFAQPVSSKPKHFMFGERVDLLSVTNPRSLPGEGEQRQGFVKGKAKFMVTDNLTVTLFSPVECISLIAKSSVPITDIDAVSVGFGVEEAKCLLRAALICKTALSQVFVLMQAKSLLRATLFSKTAISP